jgi:putative FmdB family regulatory protein
MPIYKFKCESCDKIFEIRCDPDKTENVQCPMQKGKKKHKLTRIFEVFFPKHRSQT